MGTSEMASSTTLSDNTESSYEDIDKIRYYLQYCAINSSIGRHRSACGAARKAVKMGMVYVKNYGS